MHPRAVQRERPRPPAVDARVPRARRRDATPDRRAARARRAVRLPRRAGARPEPAERLAAARDPQDRRRRRQPPRRHVGLLPDRRAGARGGATGPRDPRRVARDATGAQVGPPPPAQDLRSGGVPMTLARRVVAEGLGTALLVAAVIGSGIMAQRLAGPDVALALLANTIATGAALVALILTFGPISGAHFNPVVTGCLAFWREIAPRDAAAYVLAQILGGVVGAALANL